MMSKNIVFIGKLLYPKQIRTYQCIILRIQQIYLFGIESCLLIGNLGPRRSYFRRNRNRRKNADGCLLRTVQEFRRFGGKYRENGTKALQFDAKSHEKSVVSRRQATRFCPTAAAPASHPLRRTDQQGQPL